MTKLIIKGVRHPHPTCAGLEDALAVLIDIRQEAIILRLRGCDCDLLLDRISDAIEILQIVRADPHGYDPDRVSGFYIRLKR